MATGTATKPTVKPPTEPTPNGQQGSSKESKDAKFKRLANARVPAAIKRIRHVANLSNRLQYTFTDDQAQRIVSMLLDEVSALKRRFEAKANAATVADIF